jgi:hypothetical protein
VCRAVSYGAVPFCNVAVGLEVRYPGHLDLGGGFSVGLLSNWHITLHVLCFEIWPGLAKYFVVMAPEVL